MGGQKEGGRGGDRNQSLEERNERKRENPRQTKILCFFVEFLFCSVRGNHDAIPVWQSEEKARP
jgi:hypothetical protein